MYIYTNITYNYTFMKNRTYRHQAILERIKNNKISNQSELSNQLAKLGFEVTQATLSRDLATLKIIRLPDAEKGHIYATPDQINNPFNLLDDNFPLNAFRNISFSGTLAVLKCLPSFAPSIALLLDALEMEEIIGTIAGDDTVIIVIREDLSHEQFRESLARRLPELRERF